MTSTDGILPDEVRQFFKMNNLGVQTEIFIKFMLKIFIAFAIQNPQQLIKNLPLIPQSWSTEGLEH